MAPQRLAAARDSSMKRVGRWLRDRVWATLDPPSTNLADDVEQPKPEINADADEEIVRTVYERLYAELQTEAERRRAVESKLIAAGSVAPIAVTIMVAVATFVSPCRLQESVSESVVYTFLGILRGAAVPARHVGRDQRAVQKELYRADRISDPAVQHKRPGRVSPQRLQRPRAQA